MVQYEPATQRAYTTAWQHWQDWLAWAVRQSELASLDDYALLDRYLLDRWRGGASPPTLAAIYTRLLAGYAVVGRDWPDPGRTLPGRWRLALERRGLPRKQAQPLTAARLAVVEASGSVRERVIALIRVMRDGLLDADEVRTCRWADICTDEKGSARLRVMRPERDIWLSPATVQALVAMRPDGWSADDPVFATRRNGLPGVPRAETLTSWIRRAAQTAGLGDGYSGRSPRYGMLADLPAHVGRDPLPADLSWATRYANAEVVRWYKGTPPQSSVAAESGPPVAPVADGEFGAPQLREWLQGQGQSAAWMWQRLGIRAETVRAWQSSRTRLPPWMPLVLAADRRAGGAPAEDAPDLRQAKRDGKWSDYVLAAGLGVSRQTIQRWLRDGAPDLVLRYAIGELELRVPPAGRSGRGAAAKLRDPSYRVIDWPQDGSAPRDEADPGDAADVAEAGTRVPHSAEPTTTETAREAGALPRDAADTRAASERRAALVRVARTQLLRGWTLDDPQAAAAAFREAAAAGLEAGNPGGREIAAAALVRRADTLAARLQSSPEDVDAYRDVVTLYRAAARAGRGAATSKGRRSAAHATYNSGVCLERSGGDEAEIESAYRDAASLGRAVAGAAGLHLVALARYALGRVYTEWGRPEGDVEAAYDEAVEAGREAGEPRALEVAAEASRTLAALRARWGRPEADVEDAYQEAAELGRDAGTAGGRRTVARARAELAVRLAEWGRPESDVEAACREAVEAGREADEPRALEVAAEASRTLAALRARWGRPEADVEDAYQEAAELGRDAGTAGGRRTVARARAELAARLAEWGRPESDVEAACREAVEAGREAGEPRALEVAAEASRTLAALRARWGRPEADVEDAYQEAAELGRDAGTAGGRRTVARARAELAVRLAEWGRPEGDVEAAYDEAVEAGREAGEPRALEVAAEASRTLAALRARWGRPEADVEDAYQEAAELGRDAGTAGGRRTVARARAELAVRLAEWGRPESDVEAACREAVEAGREADEPRALEVAAEASRTLAALRARWGRPEADVEDAYQEAAELGRDAGTAGGRRTVARARAELAARLAEWGRPESDVEAACREAVEAGREADEPRALEVAAEALLSVAENTAGRGRLRRNVEPVYRDAAAVGRDAKTPKGLATAAHAMLALGDKFPYWWTWEREDAEQEVLANLPALEQRVGLRLAEARLIADARHPGWDRPVKDLQNKSRRQREATYREAAELGRKSGSVDGLTTATVAIARLAGCLDDWGRPAAEVEAAYREAAELGSESGTPEGRAVADEVSTTLHRRTSGWRGVWRSFRNSTS